MSTNEVQEELTRHIAEEIVIQIQAWAIDGLDKVARGKEDGSLEHWLAVTAQDLVRTVGPEHAADQIAMLIFGVGQEGRLDYEALAELSAADLTFLTEKLQSAEANDVRRMKEFGRKIGGALRGLGVVVAEAVRRVL